MKNSVQWFVNPTFDIFWFIASPLVAVLFYFMFLTFGQGLESISGTSSVFLFFLIFTGIFDAPHIFATFSRTTFDKIERQRNYILHIVSLVLAIALSIGSVIYDQQEIFMTLLGLYGAWHIIRQNIGFVRLYQRLNPELETDSGRDELTLLTCSLFYYYLHGHSDLDGVLSFWSQSSVLVLVLQRMSELMLLYLGVRVFYKNCQVKKTKGQWNTPKLLLILSSLLLVFWLSLIEVHPLLLIALSTIGHDLQYHAWMWIYNRRQKNQPRRAILFVSIYLGLGLLIMLGSESWAPLYNGIVLWHYFIDGFIWRFGSSPELAGMLPPLKSVEFVRSEVTLKV